MNGDTTAGAEIIVEIDEDLEDLIPGFLGNRRKDITALKTALAEANFDAAREIGHALKGAGGGYGFHAISETGRAIEDAGRTHDPARLKAGIEDLADFLARVRAVFVPVED